MHYGKKFWFHSEVIFFFYFDVFFWTNVQHIFMQFLYQFYLSMYIWIQMNASYFILISMQTILYHLHHTGYFYIRMTYLPSSITDKI